MSSETTFVAEVCRREYWIRVIFALSAFFFVLHVPYVIVVEPGTALYVVSTMNLVGTGVCMLLSGYAVRKCQSYE